MSDIFVTVKFKLPQWYAGIYKNEDVPSITEGLMNWLAEDNPHAIFDFGDAEITGVEVIHSVES